MDVRRTERRTNMKTPAEEPRCCIHMLPVNASVLFVCGRSHEANVFRILRQEKKILVRIMYFSLKASGTGASLQLPEDIRQTYFPDDAKGNTTASLHPGNPYVSALEGSH